MLDTKLLELYKSGERNFCNADIYNRLGYMLLNYIPTNYPANLINQNLVEINLSGSNLSGAKLKNTNLSGAALISTNLENADLQGANLVGANLKNTNLCGVDLSHTSLIKAVLTHAIIDNTTVLDAKTYLIWQIVNQKLVDKNLIGSDLTGACLDDANLTRVNLSYAKLGYCIDKRNHELHSSYYRTSLKSANFTEANLEYSEFIEANLENANLQRANLVRANLERANLKNAQFDEARLDHANLTQTKLKGASFKSASLYKSRLYQAEVSGSSWRGADLRKSNLLETSLNSVSTLREAYYDEETQFPSFFEPKIQKMVFWTKDHESTEFLNNLLTKKGKKEKLPPPRPGQDEFKKILMDVYDGRCIISGCNIKEAIEAAHIIPFNGLHSHHLANGLLLRADLHKLFDNYLLTINPDTRKVLIASELMNSYNEILEKQVEFCISGENLIRQKELLRYHSKKCNWINT